MAYTKILNSGVFNVPAPANDFCMLCIDVQTVTDSEPGRANDVIWRGSIGVNVWLSVGYLMFAIGNHESQHGRTSVDLDVEENRCHRSMRM